MNRQPLPGYAPSAVHMRNELCTVLPVNFVILATDTSSDHPLLSLACKLRCASVNAVRAAGTKTTRHGIAWRCRAQARRAAACRFAVCCRPCSVGAGR